MEEISKIKSTASDNNTNRKAFGGHLFAWPAVPEHKVSIEVLAGEHPQTFPETPRTLRKLLPHIRTFTHAVRGYCRGSFYNGDVHIARSPRR